jgi:DNA-binding MarR family transcriptional regulator
MKTDYSLTTDVAMGELETSVGFLLRIAQVQVYDQFFARFDPSEFRPGEFSVLWVIHLNPGIKQGRLAEALRIKPAHMTKIIRRFEQQNLLTRLIPDHDRRSVHLSLTETGRAHVEEMRPVFFGQDSYHKHSLSPKEERELVRLLRRYTGMDSKV